MAASPDNTTWRQSPPPAELPADLAQGLSFPLRPSSSSAVPDLQDQTDALNLWLLDHSDELSRYAAAAAWMNYRTALTLATSGYAHLALHYFEAALVYQPEHTSCRTNYAVALHSLKRESAALEQYELLLPRLDPANESHIFHLAARLHARHGNPRRALELLDQAAPAMPDDPSFWALHTELEARTGTTPITQAPLLQQSSDSPKFCRHCGAPLKPEARFCSQCGQAVRIL